MMPIIKVKNLSKEYHLRGTHKSILALKNVNLEIDKGEKFGLLGPNGAGKTTFISILSTIIQPTEGNVTINNYDVVKQPNKAKKYIGLMLGSEMIYYRITGYQNLKFFSKIYEVADFKQKIKIITEKLELGNWMHEFVEKYSTGMKTKLSIARMLLIDPEIFLLDEPTLGLDISTTNFIIEKLQELEKTILLCTHNMFVVEKLCERIAFINKGRIIKIGTREELQSKFLEGVPIFIELSNQKESLKDKLSGLNFILECKTELNGLSIILKNRDDYWKLFSIFQNYHITKIEERSLTLEELFLKYND